MYLVLENQTDNLWGFLLQGGFYFSAFSVFLDPLHHGCLPKIKQISGNNKHWDFFGKLDKVISGYVSWHLQLCLNGRLPADAKMFC